MKYFELVFFKTPAEGGKINHEYAGRAGRFEPDVISSLLPSPIQHDAIENHKKIKNKPLHRLIKSHFVQIDENAYFLSQINDSFKGVGKSKLLVHKEKAHGFGEMVQIAYEFANSHITNSIEGEILEFGCFTGMSTAKLSLVSNLVGKKLYAFDSFEGLPDINEYGTGEQKNIYAKNDYCGSIGLVRKNIELHGVYKDVELVKGYFSDTLKAFFEKIKI